MERTFLGIDIGTSVSRVAFANFSGDKITPDLLTKIGERGMELSMVLLDQDGIIIEYGKSALDKFISGDGYFLVKEFKLKLAAQITLPNGKIIEGAQIYKDYLKYLLKTITEKYSISLNNARICITHPADPEKVTKSRVTSICDAVIQEIFPAAAISIFSMDEPSASVQYSDHLQGFLTSKQTKVLVVDTGAGTTDFAYATAVYQYFVFRQPLDVLYTSKVDIGGGKIDLALWELIQKREKIAKQNARVEEEILKSIKVAKDLYAWEDAADLTIDLTAAGIGSIQISSREINHAIENLIEEIVLCTERFMKQVKDPVQTIILTGGNSRIPLIKQKLERKFPTILVRSIPNNEDLQTAVSKGAALFAQTTYEGIRYPLAYSVVIQDLNGKKRPLFEKGEKFPQRPKRPRQIVTSYGSGDFKFIFYKESIHGSSNEIDVNIPFDPVPSPTSKVILDFSVDADGYLRYSAELLDGLKTVSQNVLRKDLFDVSIPIWD